MNTQYKDGKIVYEGLYYEDAYYDVANNKIAVCFNGKGSIKNYSVIGDKTYFSSVYSWLKFTINGKPLGVNTKKTVEMIGRTQKTIIENNDATITIKQFLTVNDPCVFEKVIINPKRPINVEIAFSVPGEVWSDDGEPNKDFRFNNDNGFCFASNEKFLAVPGASAFVCKVSTDSPTQINMIYGYDKQTIDNKCHNIDEYEKLADNEITDIVLPSSVITEKDKAFYYSAYFCALENYKELGDFKAFIAGFNYIAPMRTYYRDSYYTVLPMYNGNTEKIKNQIVTLAKGISPDGSCPSAVINDFSPWWGQHYDSPAMFCIQLYDYVNNTGDFSILSTQVNGSSILNLAKLVLDKLTAECDETHLVVKQGKYNQRDWADEVNRYGYVTYVEVFYARALYCMSKLVATTDSDEALRYEKEYKIVKDAINDILWDESKGHYINYKNEDYTEFNLSIDTIFAVIYGIADEEKTNRMLDACQTILESRNNPEVDDFGVMCVYPVYSHIESARNKSSRPLDYHNGADWPYWSAMYAYALKLNGRDYTYPLTRWFDYNIQKGNFTPIEYYSPYCKDGSLLQAWSGVAAFVYNDVDCDFFKNKI